MRVRSFEPSDLPQVQALVALHLSAVVPGWALSEAAIARHLERNHAQPVTDPWVEDRVTLCALERYRVLAVVHLLRYADRPEVSAAYRRAGSIAWLVARPEHPAAAAAVLAAADERIAGWGVARTYGWDTGLPVPIWGVPDAWPHVAAALDALSRGNELPAHLRWALANGVTRDELIEAITRLGFYAGWPNGARYAP